MHCKQCGIPIATHGSQCGTYDGGGYDVVPDPVVELEELLRIRKGDSLRDRASKLSGRGLCIAGGLVALAGLAVGYIIVSGIDFVKGVLR